MITIIKEVKFNMNLVSGVHEKIGGPAQTELIVLVFRHSSIPYQC